MAPKSISYKIILFSLALAFCLSMIPFQVSAESSIVQEQVFKFYLDPALVPDLEFAKTVLPKYVDDINTILAKNTARRLLFDPETGIILTSSKPQTDSARFPLPTEGFEIWAHASYTSSTLSHGGYAGMDRSGAGVLAGLKWTRLYDPDNLTTNQVKDYAIQVDHMLHEMAHVFGAGMGEYYNLTSITDTTGVEPFLDIRLSNPADGFWSDKPDFRTDPLLNLATASTRTEYLATVQYSNLTAFIINGNYRNGMPSFENYTIQVEDQTGAPVADANVKVWNVRGGSSNPSELLFDVFSDENGQVTLPWGGVGSTHTSSNFLRLIKVYKDGSSIVQPRYFSVFDADLAMIVYQANTITLTLQPAPSKTQTFFSTGKNDGWVRESVQNSQVGKVINTEAGTFQLGDDSANRQYRSVLSFNTASLPDDAVITNVIIKVFRQTISGADLLTTHGDLQVDIRQGAFGAKAGLQTVDFQAASNQTNAGIVATPTTGGWYTSVLDPQTYQFINIAGISQFRLQFEQATDGDGVSDFIKFFSGDSANSAKRPQLIIEYYVP